MFKFKTKKQAVNAAIELNSRNIACCYNCKYSGKRADVKTICRRYPPVALESDGRVFPIVSGEDWCGEWAGK